MPTLREEMLERTPSEITRLGISGWYDRGFNDALCDYGGHEIVEGLISFKHGPCRLNFFVGDRCVGTVGDHIKILIPPAKPAAERDQPTTPREEQLETALSKITDKLLAGWDPQQGEARYWSGLCHTVFNIADRALEKKHE